MMKLIAALIFAGVAVGSPSLRGNGTLVHAHDTLRQLQATTLTVKPYDEDQRMIVGGPYTGGRLDLRMQSGSVTPGIITSVYLANGEGRKGDDRKGQQDEIDLEWKGNEPTIVQTNVFLNGTGDLLVINVGKNTSTSMLPYSVEWESTSVKFYVNGQLVRTKALARPLKPLSLQISLWTTSGGWPGLRQWAGGPPDWKGRNNAPVSATFEVVKAP